MEDRNRNQDQGWQNAERDDFVQALDAALAKYAAVEPRVGLEDRVLANLHAERTQATPAWWRWGAVAALAVVFLMAVVIALRPGKPAPEEVKKTPAVPVTPRQEQRREKLTANGETNTTSVPVPVRQPTSHHANFPTITLAAAASPRLDQFPSPTPLTEQEKILANYITQYPEHAALIAEARTEQLRRDEEEWHANDAGNDSALKPNR